MNLFLRFGMKFWSYYDWGGAKNINYFLCEQLMWAFFNILLHISTQILAVWAQEEKAKLKLDYDLAFVLEIMIYLLRRLSSNPPEFFEVRLVVIYTENFKLIHSWVEILSSHRKLTVRNLLAY